MLARTVRTALYRQASLRATYATEAASTANPPFQNTNASPGQPRQPVPRPPKSTKPSPFLARKQAGNPPHLLTLADLSRDQLAGVIRTAIMFKCVAKRQGNLSIRKSLGGKTVALLFSKRSTRTRVASESATALLGGHAMFLGSGDIQLGTNETLLDSCKVISSMVDGIMARVDAHEDVEELAKHSAIPVINALSVLYHPTQILADMMTLFEAYNPDFFSSIPSFNAQTQTSVLNHLTETLDPLACLQGKKAAWVGDTNNITNEMLVTLPRVGMELAVASPKGYDTVDPRVWRRVEEAGTTGHVKLTNSPEDALKDSDVVITDTWISMGQEAEKQARLDAFKGYQLTNSMITSAGAKEDWKFLHCLPRKQEEVDDEVFYGPRSLAFPEAENRKWTIMACFDMLYGSWQI